LQRKHLSLTISIQIFMKGRPDLRRSIIQNFPAIQNFTNAGHKIDEDNILVTIGVIGGIQTMIDSLCKPDDEIIFFEPIYPNHMGNGIVKGNVRLRTVRMQYNEKINQFEIDYEALKKALNDKTRLIIITSPHNPTAKVFTTEEYLKLTEIFQDYPNLIIIEDCAYFLYYEDGKKPIPFATIKPENFEKTITFYSGGKMYNVTGLRIGIAVGNKKLLSEASSSFAMTFHMAPIFEQMIIRDNMKSANELDGNSRDFYEATRQDINERVKRVQKEFETLDIPLIICEGTYYLLMDIEKFRSKVDEKYMRDLNTGEIVSKELDKAFCRMLYVEKLVGLFPLSVFYFGDNIPDNFVRISVNRNDEDMDYFFNALKACLIKLG